jgi:hypothetical protein
LLRPRLDFCDVTGVNLTVLLIGARVWRARPIEAFARATIAIALLSIEMQLATWLGAPRLSSLVVVNAVVGAVWLFAWPPPARDEETAVTADTRLPWAAIGVLTAAAAMLATRRLAGADPYHLERVTQILRLGTLEYDTTADIKVNVLASSYELVLADLAQAPWVGGLLLRLHALWSLAYFTLGVAAIRQWLPGGRRWCWSALFAVPVVFHQLAFVKNDLYSATPALVALAWIVVRARTAPAREVAAAAALVGMAVAMKWVAFPLAIAMTGWIAWYRLRDASAVIALVCGGLAGALAGGLPFTLVQTARWYGDLFAPLDTLGNRTTGIADALTSVGRFAISLIDFGQLTRRWWPGRGGWGATFGAPFIWAVAVAAMQWASPVVRGAAIASGCYLAIFAAVYPDADVAHRLVLAPGLLLIAVAAQHTDGEGTAARSSRRLLAIALLASALQIARSLWIYMGG